MEERYIVFEWLRENYAKLPVIAFAPEVCKFIRDNMTCLYIDKETIYKIETHYYRLHEIEEKIKQ